MSDIDERVMRREERIAVAQKRMRLVLKAESRMTHLTRHGRPFERHMCREMPYGYELRRYGCRRDRFDDECLPTYTWTIVRVEVPDYWIDGDECFALALNMPSSEPRFCPWCGDALGRASELIRGWDGRSGILTREDFL